MDVELQGRGDPEVAAAAATSPRTRSAFSSRLAVTTRPSASTSCAERRLSIARPYLPLQPAEPAAKRQSADARRRDDAAGAGEAVDLRLAVVLTPRSAALRARRPRRRIDVDPLHQREIEQQSAVDRRASRDVVAAAAHRDLEAVLPSEPRRHRRRRRHCGSGRSERPLVDQAVVHQTRIFVSGVERLQQLTGKTRRQRVERVRNRSLGHMNLLNVGRREVYQP